MVQSLESPLKERCRIIDLPQYTDTRGTLSVLEAQNTLFPYQRVFWIYGVPQSAQRGGHAHRTCQELLVAVSGSLDVELSDGIETLKFHLSEPSCGLLIPEYVWCRLHNFSTDFVGLCFASQAYDLQGYIHDYEDFVEEVLKNKSR